MAGFQGKRHSEETKRWQSELMRGRKHSPETLAKRHTYAEAHRPTKDFLLSEIIQFRNENNRLPRKRDMHKRKGYSGLYQYDYVFGSWRKALQSLPLKYQDEVKHRLQPEGTVKTGIRFRVFWRDGFTCQYCGRKAPEIVLELDHVVPVSKGGKTTMQNLVTACRECNAGKQSILLHERAICRAWQEGEIEMLPYELDCFRKNSLELWYRGFKAKKGQFRWFIKKDGKIIQECRLKSQAVKFINQNKRSQSQ